MDWETWTQTRGQASNNRWFEERKKRVTGTLAGRIMTCRDLKQFKRNDDKRIDFLPGVKYGRENEPKALKLYRKRFGRDWCIIEDSGLCALETNSYVAASPDGLRIHYPSGALSPVEVKTIYQRDAVLTGTRGDTITQLTKKRKGFFLDQNGVLRKSHSYYGQIQLEIYCTEARSADLVVYNPTNKNELLVQKVKRDEEYIKKLLLKAESFLKMDADPTDVLLRMTSDNPFYYYHSAEDQWTVECHLQDHMTKGFGASLKQAKNRAAETMVRIIEEETNPASRFEMIRKYEAEGKVTNLKYTYYKAWDRYVTIARGTNSEDQDIVVTGTGITRDISHEDASNKLFSKLFT